MKTLRSVPLKRTIIIDHLRCGPLKTVGFFRKKHIQDYMTAHGIVRETTSHNSTPKYEIVRKGLLAKNESINVIIQ